MSLTTHELERFVEDLVADESRWAHLVRHDPQARIYALVHDDAEVNAWLICWSEDQDTGFHDHDISAAAIHVVSGEVREDRLRLAGPPISRVSGAGDRLSLEPCAIHRILHHGSAPAVTIHAYSPPLVRTGAYYVAPDGELQRVAQSFQEELRAEAVLV